MTVEAPSKTKKPKKKRGPNPLQNEHDIIDAVRELMGLDPLYRSKNKTGLSKQHQYMIANPYIKLK